MLFVRGKTLGFTTVQDSWQYHCFIYLDL